MSWLTRMLPTCVMGLALPALAAGQPNIVFILTDDLGWGDLGVFHQNGVAGPKKHATPNLDAFAQEGVQLRQHYCPAPVCAPSRASLLLGVHQGHANVRDNQFDKALEDNHTLASVLQQAGYTTALIGKYGLQGPGSNPAEWPAYPTRRGFDFFFGYVRHSDGHQHYPGNPWPLGNSPAHRSPKELYENGREISGSLDKCYTADLFTARAKKWIGDHRQTAPETPFFLYLAYDTPHAALQLPAVAYPSGGGVRGGVQWLGAPGRVINTAVGTIDSYRHPDYTGKGWSDVEERFATSVRRIDDCVGDLVQTFEDLGIDRNTLVVFSSDNGPHKESYMSLSYDPDSFDSFGPFDGIKRDTWEGGVRMPSLARWPGVISPGRINERPSQFHDWLPTFADAAGLPAPARSDGVSLLPLLTGAGDQRPTLTYIEYFNGGTTPPYSEFDPSHQGRRRRQMQVIHLEGYKGVRYNIASHADDFEIYDVNADPRETKNLAADPSFANLQQAMKDTVLRVRRPNDSAPRPYDNELVPAVTERRTVPGVRCRTYEGEYPWVPELTVLTPVVEETRTALDLGGRTRDEHFGLLFTGLLSVPRDGEYTFFLSTDTGALLRLHEATVIDADYGYPGGTERSGAIRLEAGLHPFRLYYRHGAGPDPSLRFEWSGPELNRQPISNQALFVRPASADRAGRV